VFLSQHEAVCALAKRVPGAVEGAPHRVS